MVGSTSSRGTPWTPLPRDDLAPGTWDPSSARGWWTHPSRFLARPFHLSSESSLDPLTFYFSSQEVSKNLTKENEQIKEDVEEIRTEMNKRSQENCSRNGPHSAPDVGSALQRDAAAAYTHPEVQPSPARHTVL